MCASGCGESATVSIAHSGVGTFEMVAHSNSTELPQSLGDLTTLLAIEMNGCGCADFSDTTEYPYCSWVYGVNQDAGATFYYGLIFFYTGTEWKCRIMIHTNSGPDVCYTLDKALGVTEIDCTTYDETDNIPDCDSVEPDESVTVTIT